MCTTLQEFSDKLDRLDAEFGKKMEEQNKKFFADKPDEATLSPEMKEHYEKFEKMIKEHTDKFNKKMREHSAHFKQKFAELLEQQKNAQFSDKLDRLDAEFGAINLEDEEGIARTLLKDEMKNNREDVLSWCRSKEDTRSELRRDEASTRGTLRSDEAKKFTQLLEDFYQEEHAVTEWVQSRDDGRAEVWRIAESECRNLMTEEINSWYALRRNFQSSVYSLEKLLKDRLYARDALFGSEERARFHIELAEAMSAMRSTGTYLR